MGRTLCRSRRDRSLAGVCGGVAEHFGWSSTGVRFAWIVLALFGGSGILLYLILWLLMLRLPESRLHRSGAAVPAGLGMRSLTVAFD